ncbi:hypothetical protein SAMN02746095_00603 [Acidocella aminolytica 101 = DSM 11237]|uniref:hypothetical protein n=2 Tax=Acidocella aminolytica TaxID=33998 RepID=UPI00090F553A|nr:hypothetical protein [Acidocella aminolytica]GBQ42116.1 hypothetical protein AA11237_2873 [Acidocella aminolytica 101 = DSM 11237]SHE47819.1 hypothetical protein SAMN02746095_00603 [Acidocella aminolytica 101 = DSM 11237]
MTQDPFHFLFNDRPPSPAKPERERQSAPHTNGLAPAASQLGQSQRVILSGQLVYADTELRQIDCVVLELRPGGAIIEMTQPANLPDYLFFRIGDTPIRPVLRIHTQGNSIELEYAD